jgi:predicted MFS family arabinose efflux permease
VRRLPETRPRRARAEGVRPDAAPVPLRVILRRVAVPGTVTVALIAAFGAFEATFALFAAHRLGFGLGAIGAVFAMVGVVAAVVQGGVVRPLAARLGEATCLRIGLASEALGLVLLPTAHHRVSLVVPLVLVTVGQSLSTPALSALVVARVGAGARGAALGAQQGLSSLARIIGPAAGGVSYALLGVAAPFVGGGMVLAVTLVFSLVMRNDLESSPGVLVEPVVNRLPLGNNG